MKNLGFYILGIVGGLMLLHGCARPKEIGPELAIASPNFKIETPLKAKFKTKNFFPLNSYNFFTAKFNERVSWKLTIKGLTSNAFRNYSGTSDYLDSTLTLWDGGTNGKGSEVNLFFKGEKTVAFLDILGYETTVTDTVTITNTKRPASAFVPLAEYETNSTKNGVWNADELIDNTLYNDKQSEFGKSPYFYYFAKLRDAPDTYEQYRDNVLDAPEGTNYLVIDAKDNSKDYYITNFGFNFGGTEAMFGSAQIQNKRYMPNADSLYLNFFLYGNGSGNKSRLGVTFNELKDPATGFEDVFNIDIDPNHVGWKFFSIKYSDIAVTIPDYVLPTIPKGYTPVKEGDKIASIGFQLKTLTNNGDAFKLIIDYPVVTYGKPLLNPNE
jgi:hypothetical protein